MSLIYARYNMYHNSIDVALFDDYILRIDCNKAEEGLKTTAWTDHVLNAMSIENPVDICNLLFGEARSRRLQLHGRATRV